MGNYNLFLLNNREFLITENDNLPINKNFEVLLLSVEMHNIVRYLKDNYTRIYF